MPESTPSSPKTRVCHRCNIEYPLTIEWFVRNSASKSGFTGECRNCHNAYRQERREKARVERGAVSIPDGFRECGVCHRILPATREYFSTNKMGKNGLQSFCKQCGAETQKRYRREHPERVSASEKKRNQNPERRAYNLQKGRELYHDDPNKVAKTREKNLRRRARKYNAEGSHTQHDEFLQLQYQKYRCWWCGKKLTGKYEADHLVPLSGGGTDYPNNIVIACVRCNRSKHDKMPYEWAGRLF